MACIGSISHALYLSHLSLPVFAGVLENGKVNVSIFGLGCDGAGLHQVPGEMVQCASQVLGKVSDQRREFERYFLMHPEIVRSLLFLRIVLGDDFVGIGGLKKSIRRELKIDEGVL